MQKSTRASVAPSPAESASAWNPESVPSRFLLLDPAFWAPKQRETICSGKTFFSGLPIDTHKSDSIANIEHLMTSFIKMLIYYGSDEYRKLILSNFVSKSKLF